jgi:RNA polymerase sigma-70 factor (ECF subfamily)
MNQPLTCTRPHASHELDLAVLLKRTASGDAEAFGQFYDATAAAAYGLALRVVTNRALAEEVTQEAYLDLWRAPRRFDPQQGMALTFLITIVHRRAVDRVRTTRAAIARDAVYHRQQPTVDHDPTAETAHARLGASKIRSALAALTTEQQQAIELAYFGGFTQCEVAAALGIHSAQPKQGSGTGSSGCVAASTSVEILLAKDLGKAMDALGEMSTVRRHRQVEEPGRCGLG